MSRHGLHGIPVLQGREDVNTPALAIQDATFGRLYPDPGKLAELPTTKRGTIASLADGALVPSITNVLRAMAIPGLTRWEHEQMARAVLDRADDTAAAISAGRMRDVFDVMAGGPAGTLAAAGERGTRIHAAIERRILGISDAGIRKDLVLHDGDHAYMAAWEAFAARYAPGT